MKLLIAGTARDIEKYWHTTRQSLDAIFNSDSDYKCVIVESNSRDNTLSVLNKWAKDDSRRVIISLGYLNESIRTKRIAQARNTYLKYFRDNNLFISYDYLLVLDLHSKSYNNIQDILSQQINAIENINSQFLKTTNYKITDTTQYILIQLVIFEFNGDEFIKKNLHITNLNDVLCIDGILFELISMIVHIGNFAGGHYINYSKQYDPSTKTCNWYKYDDNIHPDSDYDTRHIKPTPSPEAPVFLGPLLDLPSKKDLIPYVLLYKKIS